MHPNFVWCSGLNIPTFSQSLVPELPLVQKCLKLKKLLNLSFNYGWISHELQQLRYPNFFVMLRLEDGNFLSKIGTWTTVGSEMLKVRKIAKSVLQLWVDISWTTTAKASKFCVMLKLERGNFLSKFGTWTIVGSEMLKVRKIAKSGFQVK